MSVDYEDARLERLLVLSDNQMASSKKTSDQTE
jgi:hypothetical protein